MTRFSSMMASDYAVAADNSFDLTFGWKANEQKFKNGGIFSVMDSAYGMLGGSVGIFAADNHDAPVFFATDNKVRVSVNGSGLRSNVPVFIPRNSYGTEWENSTEAAAKGDVRAELELLRAEIEKLKGRLPAALAPETKSSSRP